MAHRVLIPTPLRPYTAQQDVVEADGRTVGDVLSALTSRYGDLRRHLYRRRRKASQLREHLRERRRHPLSRSRANRAQPRRCDQHRAVGGRRRAGDRPEEALPQLTQR